MLQVPFSFIFSAFIDMNMAITGSVVPSNYFVAVGVLLSGCVAGSRRGAGDKAKSCYDECGGIGEIPFVAHE